MLATVVGPPEPARRRVLPLPGLTVTSLDQGVHAIGVGPGHRKADLAPGLAGQAVALDLLPSETAVGRAVQAAAGSAALAAPRVDLDLPGARKQDARVVRVHDQVRTPGLLIDEERLRPGLATVRRAEHTPVRLRSVRSSECASEGDLGIARIHHNARDASGGLESRPRPRAAGVGRTIPAPADCDVAADE